MKAKMPIGIRLQSKVLFAICAPRRPEIVAEIPGFGLLAYGHIPAL